MFRESRDVPTHSRSLMESSHLRMGRLMRRMIIGRS